MTAHTVYTYSLHSHTLTCTQSHFIFYSVALSRCTHSQCHCVHSHISLSHYHGVHDQSVWSLWRQCGASVVVLRSLWWSCGHSEVTLCLRTWSLWCHFGHSEVAVLLRSFSLRYHCGGTVVTVVVLWSFCGHCDCGHSASTVMVLRSLWCHCGHAGFTVVPL